MGLFPSRVTQATTEIYIGVLIGSLASIFSNIGVNTQKYSFLQEALKPLEERKGFTSQWRWWLGTVLVVLAAILDLVSFAMAPQTLIAPTGALSPVSNVFFAHFWLGEKLTRRDLIGTFLVCVGAVVVLAFGTHKDPDYTLTELKHLYVRPPMIGYMVATVILCGLMYLVVLRAEWILIRSHPTTAQPSEKTGLLQGAQTPPRSLSTAGNLQGHKSGSLATTDDGLVRSASTTALDLSSASAAVGLGASGARAPLQNQPTSSSASSSRPSTQSTASSPHTGPIAIGDGRQRRLQSSGAVGRGSKFDVLRETPEEGAGGRLSGVGSDGLALTLRPGAVGGGQASWVPSSATERALEAGGKLLDGLVIGMDAARKAGKSLQLPHPRGRAGSEGSRPLLPSAGGGGARAEVAHFLRNLMRDDDDSSDADEERGRRRGLRGGGRMRSGSDESVWERKQIVAHGTPARRKKAATQMMPYLLADTNPVIALAMPVLGEGRRKRRTRGLTAHADVGGGGVDELGVGLMEREVSDHKPHHASPPPASYQERPHPPLPASPPSPSLPTPTPLSPSLDREPDTPHASRDTQGERTPRVTFRAKDDVAVIGKVEEEGGVGRWAREEREEEEEGEEEEDEEEEGEEEGSEKASAKRLALIQDALQDPPEEYAPYARAHAVFYGVLAGYVGAMTVLFSKSISETVKTTIAGDNQFVYWETYFLIFFIVITVVLQQKMLANGLQLFDALLIVPVFSATFMGINIISGGIYFEEFNGFDTTQSIFFPVGVLLTLAGVYVLSERRKFDPKERLRIIADEDGEDEEDGDVDENRVLDLEGAEEGGGFQAPGLQIRSSAIPNRSPSPSPRAGDEDDSGGGMLVGTPVSEYDFGESDSP